MSPSAATPVHGEPSLAFASDRGRAHLTLRGGMLAPVEFTLADGRVVTPYSLAPWSPADFAADQPPLLQVLRGDFFCFPFGVTPGLPHPHGATANLAWTPREVARSALTLELRSTSPAVHVVKEVALRDGETNLYQRHRVTVAEPGRYNYGHHPILHVPAGVTAEVRTSAFSFGGVYPGHADRPPGERGVLAPGARFASLAAVPRADGGTASLTRYPLRPGHEDIVMLAGFREDFAWTAVTLDGYVWFALRRVRDFPGTLFWMSDGGRDFAPWRGRHTRRLGVEDVCSHYCDGLDLSRRDLLAAEGIATTREFAAGVAVDLPHVQGVVAVPPDFGGVAALTPEPDRPDRARLVAESGATVTFPLQWQLFHHD